LLLYCRCLLDPGPDIVICDEGHLLKNEKSALNKAVNRIKTLRRIILTGTPLQNNLKEYYEMVNFVKPNLLGTRKEFMNRFVNPISNGQHSDSTERDIRMMKQRSFVLNDLLKVRSA
jgi:transcriptional regulator ATRX